MSRGFWVTESGQPAIHVIGNPDMPDESKELLQKAFNTIYGRYVVPEDKKLSLVEYAHQIGTLAKVGLMVSGLDLDRIISTLELHKESSFVKESGPSVETLLDMAEKLKPFQEYVSELSEQAQSIKESYEGGGVL